MTSDPAAQNPDPAAQNPGAAAQSPGRAAQNPGTAAQNPGTGAQSPGTAAQRPGTAAGRRLPQGHWGWLDVLIVGPLIASSVWYYAGIPLGQWLILHEQAISAALLRGSVPAMILSGAQVRTAGVSLWIALLAPLPITMCTDPCCFYGGRRYGRALIDYLGRSDPRWNRRLARAERIYARFAGWAVFLAPVIWLPNALFYFLAGETRMRFRTFIVLDAAGELCFIGEIVAIGYFIGKPAEDVVNTLSGYSLPIILGTIAVAVVLSVAGSSRRSRAGPTASR